MRCMARLDVYRIMELYQQAINLLNILFREHISLHLANKTIVSANSFILLLLPFLAASFSAPAAKTCTDPQKRVNWETLNLDQRQSYASAVKCLQTRPSVGTLPNATNHFDDFVSLHIKESDNIHFNAHFLPWHRQFVLLRENALKDCGYSGPTPYWDWTVSADKADVINDPIWDPVSGLGGNGTGQGNVVTDGPFANFTVDLAVDREDGIVDVSKHLLRRNFNNGPDTPGTKLLDWYYNSSAVQVATSIQNFTYFAEKLESGPHGAVHSMIGGDMIPVQSPNDPIFFLHHAQIDRIWTKWQSEDSKRLTDFGGILPKGSFKNGPFDAKLTDKLPFDGWIEDPTVSMLMDTQDNGLCYEYV